VAGTKTAGSFYKALFGDLGIAPTWMCLGKSEALSGTLGDAIQAEEPLKAGNADGLGDSCD
jgi:hypothetical protein